jgi:cytochrome c peroxidase
MTPWHALLGTLSGLLLASASAAATAQKPKQTPKPPSAAQIALGKTLFFDTQLSEPAGVSCASCHDPQKAFSDPRAIPFSPGAVPGRFSPRHAPSIAYAQFTPPLHYDERKRRWAGGQFWDGRVDSLAEQAIIPLTNPLEMNLDKHRLLSKVQQAPYAQQLAKLYGPAALKQPDAALKAVASALAAYQQGPEFARFDAKYDAFVAGRVDLTEQERRGLMVFSDKGKCMDCHLQFNADHTRERAVLSDHSYHNIGVPRATAMPFLSLPAAFNPAGTDYRDLGLAANGRTLSGGDPATATGKFRTPGLRNISRTAPYMHNGSLKTLREVVEFYNTRDTNKARWGEPEVKENLDTISTGNLHLSDSDIDALLAFLETLNDGYTPSPQP